MKIIPNGTAMVVRPFAEKQITESGVHLTKSMDEIMYAEVLRAGPGWWSAEFMRYTPLPYKAGEILAFPINVPCRPIDVGSIITTNGTKPLPKQILVDVTSVIGLVEFDDEKDRAKFLDERQKQDRPSLKLSLSGDGMEAA